MRHGEHKSPARRRLQDTVAAGIVVVFFSGNIRIGIWREYFDLCNGEGIFRPKASSTKLHELTVCSQLRNDPRKEYCQSSGNPQEKTCMRDYVKFMVMSKDACRGPFGDLPCCHTKKCCSQKPAFMFANTPAIYCATFAPSAVIQFPGMRSGKYSLYLKIVRFSRQNRFVICNKPIGTLLAAKTLRSFCSQRTQESI